MASRVLLFPREYGAYAELAFPLLTGLLAGGSSVAGAAFAVAATAGFLLREPLAVMGGARGVRIATSRRLLARRLAAALVGLGAAAAAVAMLTATPSARVASTVPAGIALAVAPALLRGRTKTLAREVLVAFAFATMVLPVGRAGSMSWPAAVGASATWAVSFVLATLAVHGIKARFKPERGRTWTLWAAPIVAVMVGAIGLLGAVLWRLPAMAAFAPVPPACVVVATSALRTHPRQLKRVGWALVAANMITLALLLARA
jgi:YwiC-like protein